VYEVHDASIAIEQAAHDRQQERVRHVDAAEGQALGRSEANREEPSIQLDVAECRSIGDPSSTGLPRSVADRPTNAAEEQLNEVRIFGVEGEVTSIS